MPFDGTKAATDSENQGKEANLSLEIPYAIALVGEPEVVKRRPRPFGRPPPAIPNVSIPHFETPHVPASDPD